MYNIKVEELNTLANKVEKLNGRILELERERRTLQTIVDEQADDDGLWFVALTAPEAYLQQELRKLHAAIDAARAKEGK